MQGECLSQLLRLQSTSPNNKRDSITKVARGVKLLELEVWGLFKGQHLLIRRQRKSELGSKMVNPQKQQT